MKCGKKGCRCTTGKLHSAFYLSFRHDGKTMTVHIPKEVVPLVKTGCENWKCFKAYLGKETEKELHRLLKVYRKKKKAQ